MRTGSIAVFFILKGYHHGERHDFSIRAAEALQSETGDAAADPEQFPEACR
jgi:hypothetical protein